MTAETPGIIYSRLAKASYLAGNSSFFPLLVGAACAQHAIPHSQEVVQWCATRPEILDALTMSEDTALDDVLRAFARDEAAAQVMDNLILSAVQSFKELS